MFKVSTVVLEVTFVTSIAVQALHSLVRIARFSIQVFGHVIFYVIESVDNSSQKVTWSMECYTFLKVFTFVRQ